MYKLSQRHYIRTKQVLSRPSPTMHSGKVSCPNTVSESFSHLLVAWMASLTVKFISVVPIPLNIPENSTTCKYSYPSAPLLYFRYTSFAGGRAYIDPRLWTCYFRYGVPSSPSRFILIFSHFCLALQLTLFV